MTTWLVSGLRTPFARVDGPLRRLDSVALSVPVAKAMAAQLPRGRPDLVVWGTVAPNLGWSNIARELVIDAGIDPATPAVSTVLACSTSMVAVFEAAGMLRQDLSVALCGGVESMSRVQIGLKQGFSDWMRRFTQARSFGERVDRVGEFRWKDFGLHVPSVANRATGKSMGEHCEEMAKQWKIPRAEQDRIALMSHQRAVKAMASGFFDDLVMAVEGMAKDGIPRADSSAEKLASLRPAFDRASGQGTITDHKTERSAALQVYSRDPYPDIDLRVDLHEKAVDELRRIYIEYKQYEGYYRQRGEHPRDAPSQETFMATLQKAS